VLTACVQRAASDMTTVCIDGIAPSSCAHSLAAIGAILYIVLTVPIEDITTLP